MNGHFVLRTILSIWLISSSLPTIAAEFIGIDARNTGNVVAPDMFGANYVFTWNTLTQLDNTLAHLKQKSVRYPGGSVAENDFNLVNPFEYLSGNTVPADKNIRRYIEMVNRHNWRAVFVLPTERYKNNTARGKREVSDFVRLLLQGNFGHIESGRTIHFEVGNEFYFNRQDITPTEYGIVAKALVEAIDSGVNLSNRKRSYDIEVSVQSGITVDDAAAVAAQLKSRGHLIDYLTFHWYPARAEIQLGFWRMYGVTQTFGDRLKSISAQWRKHGGFSKPYFLSEFNISSKRGVDFGLRNPLGVMSIFSEAVRGDARLATIWPLVAKGNNLPAKLFRSSGNQVTPTTNGIFYDWLYDTVRGSRIIEGITNTSYSNKNNFRKGIYTQAFRKGRDTLVVYAFGTEDVRESVALTFGNFVISSASAQRLYTGRGQENDPNVVASITGVTPRVWGNNTKATFTMNRFSNYEVVKLVFRGQFR
ncbi:MAG: hypothetical protein AB8B64_23050 [Granulosicoccus sp.]